ncbi:uncharacterized protein [Coffea arabica]|uniref:Uncharacterized protein isoform X1 n=3 Tax=Coffea arabica TaxID=13443 RepID=A0A6P6UFC0_COFAR
MYIDSEVLGEGLTSTGGAILSYSSALAAALPMDDEADKNSNAAAPHNPDEQAQAAAFHKRVHEMVARDSRNFDSWTGLVEEVEGMCPDNLDLIALAYDSFLSMFPLCHWYWTKYTDHIIRLSDAHKAVKVYERAVDSTPFSTGLWVDYCCFGMCFYEDPSDVRRLFKRALLFVRKDYFCHALWNQYIKYEFTQQHWGFLANIYLQVLKFPTEYLDRYYENFKQFVVGLDEEMKKHENCSADADAGSLPNHSAKLSEDEIIQVVEDLQNASNEALLRKAVNKYKLIGEIFYQKAKELDEKIKNFETNIQRRYFDTAPLDDAQLKNWHHYLDFIEKQDDFDWALQLYERCLITCTNYPEFWMRYVEFMESKGGRELANSALQRATQVFLKFFQGVPEIHLFNARYKERIGDVNAAVAAFLNSDVLSDSLPRHIVELANMRRRLGNLEAASDTLKNAINMAEKKQKLHSLPSLFIHYSRLKYMITGSAEAARDALIDGIQRIPHCSKLLEELIKFAMMHEGAKQVDLIDSIIGHAISPSSEGTSGLALKDREHVSSLFMEFVDLCGTVHDISKAWNRHIQLFPQLVRNNLIDKELDLGKCLSDQMLVIRESGSCAFPNLLDEDQHSNQPVEEQVSLLPANHASKDELVSADQTPQKCNNTVDCERGEHLSTQEADKRNFGAFEVDEVAHHSMLQSADDTPRVMESMDNLTEQHKENVPAQMTPASVQISSKATSEPNALTSNSNCQSSATVILESAEEHSCPMNMQDQKHKQHPNPVSFGNLSLNSQEKASQKLIAMASDEHDAASDISKSTDCLNANSPPNRTAAADSVEVQESPDETRLAGLLSSATQQVSTPTKMHPSSMLSPSAGGECHQMLKGTVSEGKSSEMHLPTTHPYPQHSLVWKQGDHAEVYCKENAPQENLASKHVWLVNSMPDMSSSSTNPSHIATDHGQTLSQTLPYQQHLLQQQYQQQLVQMLPLHHQHQQSYLHHQQLLPQQQQQHQQQASSWQQQQYHQQHQQLLSLPYQGLQIQQQMPHLQQIHQQVQPHYHQSAEQLQLQHAQQLQQQFAPVPEQQLQLYHQSQKLAYDMHQQGYQGHAAQVHQTLFQQYQLYQQGYGQMLQQHQQHPYHYNQMLLQQPPQHQQQDEQQEHHQKRASNQDLSQGISQHLWGQQTAPQGADSTLLRHSSPQSMAQLNTERQSGLVASSHQQPFHGISPSRNRDTPESAASSHHGR